MENHSNLTIDPSDQPDLSSHRWPGVILITYSTICIFAYALCMITILTKKNTRELPSYQIMLHIGTCDMIQLSLNGILGGLFSIGQSQFNDYLNKMAGGLMNTCWIVYLTMAHLLAWNRCLQTYKPAAAKRLFTLRNTRLILGACWIYGSAWMITYLCPELTLRYYPPFHYWDYELEFEKSRIFSLCELVQDTVHCLGMITAYVAVFFKLAQQAKQISSPEVNSDRKERAVLMQSIWICATSTSNVTMWYCLIIWPPSSLWLNFIYTLLWNTAAGSNAFIYLIFNKSIKRQVKKILSIRRIAVGVLAEDQQMPAMNAANQGSSTLCHDAAAPPIPTVQA